HAIVLPVGVQLRQIKYLNNMIEQDHRFIKKRVRYMLEFHSFRTASATLAGIESMHMIKKGQTLQGEKSVRNQIQLINNLFGLTA
ncbi:DDE-type integrase/transposase/recombinase, partial [Bacillus toyonensis]